MAQTFETADGTAGLLTRTWPFPDNSTGSVPQGPDRETTNGKVLVKDATRDYPGPLFKMMQWGFSATKPAEINSITVKLKHSGYFISVYGQEDSVFSISATTTRVPKSSVLRRAVEEERRQRLTVDGISAVTRVGTGGTMIRVSWPTPALPFHPVLAPSGFHANDSYMLYWAADTRSLYADPASGAALGQKLGCKNPPPYNSSTDPTAPACDGDPLLYGPPQHGNSAGHCDLSSNATARAACVMWTGCGVRAAAGHPDWDLFNASASLSNRSVADNATRGSSGSHAAAAAYTLPQRTPTLSHSPPAGQPSVGSSWYRRFAHPRTAHNMGEAVGDPRVPSSHVSVGTDLFYHPIDATTWHEAGRQWRLNHKVSAQLGPERWAAAHTNDTRLWVDVHVECAYPTPPASSGQVSYCSDRHFRSKMYYFSVLRVHGATGVEEVYTGVRGSTEFDKVIQAVSNQTVAYIGSVAGTLIALIVGMIVYTKVRTNMQIKAVYASIKQKKKKKTKKKKKKKSQEEKEGKEGKGSSSSGSENEDEALSQGAGFLGELVNF